MESEDENVAAIKGSAMVYCTECGFANEQGNAFCSQCGSPLEQPEANPAAPASPEPPAGRPGVDHTKAVVIVLIAPWRHRLFITPAQPQAQTSHDDALGSMEVKAERNNAKDKNSGNSWLDGEVKPFVIVV